MKIIKKRCGVCNNLRRPVKPLVLTFFPVFLFAFSLAAQPVTFTYNRSGHRTSRSCSISLRSMTRSSAVDSAGVSAGKKSGEAEIYRETLPAMEITIYPNPTRGMLRVDLTGGKVPQGASISLFHLSGQLIRRWTGISSSNVLDISSQPSGSYLLRIELDKTQVSAWKVIKE